MAAERTWRKSSYSSGGTGDSCVEVSLAQDALVRDTKNASGDVLAFSTPAWRALINWL
ncbi:uncharacterized protein DUF397 [Lentzea atacamensis]|jgi:hypothetical protein|uniref:Uncharacterized protein DUF397 n=1 Tax=Lentzea atacamensis TaxID=531938 RepID=A0ABX9E6I0_9PSEU|nr:DUF397 domain-containing protein [Lentzea atacamensis]RAS64985.1 uncharacterized protein DUF397 [Lentzea atacamensis]